MKNIQISEELREEYGSYLEYESFNKFIFDCLPQLIKTYDEMDPTLKERIRNQIVIRLNFESEDICSVMDYHGNTRRHLYYNNQSTFLSYFGVFPSLRMVEVRTGVYTTYIDLKDVKDYYYGRLQEQEMSVNSEGSHSLQ